jgi:ADP-ribose pyrophosphatase YjhB (NUDIX family)
MRVRVGVQALIVRDHAVLVIEKRDAEGQIFILPGGGQEAGETLADAVRRECTEEISAAVEVGPLLHVRELIVGNHLPNDPERDHIINMIFSCRVPDSYEPTSGDRPDAAQARVLWMSFTDLQTANFYPRTLVPIIVGGRHTPVYLGDVN